MLLTYGAKSQPKVWSFEKKRKSNVRNIWKLSFDHEKKCKNLFFSSILQLFWINDLFSDIFDIWVFIYLFSVADFMFSDYIFLQFQILFFQFWTFGPDVVCVCVGGGIKWESWSHEWQHISESWGPSSLMLPSGNVGAARSMTPRFLCAIFTWKNKSSV